MPHNAMLHRLFICATLLMLNSILVYATEAAPMTSSTVKPKSRFPTYFGKVVKAHGITGSTAWVLVLPIGAMVMRLLRLRGSRTYYIHSIIQALGVLLFIVNFGTGIYIGIQTRKLINYHTIIGFLMFALVWSQPITGLVHHVLYKKGQGRTESSYTHIWLGRVLVTLGMINGGLGLRLGYGVMTKDRIIYGVVAGVMWVAYVIVSVHGEMSGRREEKRLEALALTKEGSHDSGMSVA